MPNNPKIGTSSFWAVFNIEYLPATKDSRIAGQTASAPVILLMAVIFLTADLFCVHVRLG
jgi:hypothetical protein